jgi:hypothetical protein
MRDRPGRRTFAVNGAQRDNPSDDGEVIVNKNKLECKDKDYTFD